MTTPTTNTTIVLGKYLGCLLFNTFIIALTSVYYFIIKIFGKPDTLAIAVGYFGIWLEGAFFISIGLMTSSWTKNQILAAVSSYAIIFSLYFSFGIVKYIDGTLELIIRHLSTLTHAENFAAAIVTL